MLDDLYIALFALSGERSSVGVRFFRMFQFDIQKDQKHSIVSIYWQNTQKEVAWDGMPNSFFFVQTKEGGFEELGIRTSSYKDVESVVKAVRRELELSVTELINE